jgi:D-alanine-D-alanine ligase
MTAKKTIAVIFGGRSVEHDVSILTGLQFLEALDPTRFDGLPIYVDALGQWWTGSALLDRTYYPADTPDKKLTAVTLDLAAPAAGTPRLITRQKALMGEKTAHINFDLMVPAIHGSNGEDGTLQGLLEFASIPFAGCRTLGAAATMNKEFAKASARQSALKVLPEVTFTRPEKGSFLDPETLSVRLTETLGSEPFPVIVKPSNLGSSVGVSKASDIDELVAALMTAFRLDRSAIVEPFVPNLVEYNIAVRRNSEGIIETSAIERPLSKTDVLDFKNKYLAGGAPGGPKLNTGPSEGMASLSRVLNPEELTAGQETVIRETAAKLFASLDLAGSVRIDFLCNGESGEIWFNEANTIPGSFAYFLWEAAETPISFLKLTNDMVTEGFMLSAARLGATDVAIGDATIFTRG